MFHPLSIFIGLRYSRSRSRTGFVSFITFFSIAGILLGVASLITVVSVMNGFEGELKKRVLGIIPHVVVSDKVQGKAIVNWQDERETLLKQPHVLHVSPFLESEALIQSSQSLKGVLLQGIIPDFERDSIISQNIVAGSFINLSKAPYSIVIGASLAQQLKVSLGSTVRIVLPNKMVFTPMGRVPVQRNFTVTGIFDVGSQVDDVMVFVASKYGVKLLRKKGDGISHLRLYLDDAFNATIVVNALNNLPLNEETKQYNELIYSTWNDSQGAFFSAVKMEKNMMWLMLSLIIAVAAFNIVSALVMVVVDKQGEIGILKTLGLDNVGVIKIFITQGMINGLWGVGLGSILGLVLTFNLNNILNLLGLHIFGGGYSEQMLPVQLDFYHVFAIIMSALFMSFIATLYPAFHASKTHPAEVLRNE